MRLIDADKLLCDLKDLDSVKVRDYQGMTRAAYITIRQPTAYDPDKIVKQLKNDSSVKLYGSKNSNNYLIPVERAVEIVKGGGVDA